MKPKFLFTLGGDLGQQTISEPEGWAKIIFNLERDLTYWSLIENFEVPLIFYGTAESRDGGYQYLADAKANGIDTLVTLEIQISFDEGSSYELCFDGRIDLSTCKEIVYRSKIEAAIVRNDLWAVFMAKKSTPVNLLSPTDIYGNTRYGIPYQEINLPSQKIFKQYYADFSVGNQVFTANEGSTGSGKYSQFDWDEEIIAEIGTKYNLPIDINPDLPANVFEMDEAGVYTFNIRFEVSKWIKTLVGCNQTNAITTASAYIDFYIKRNDDTEIIFTVTNTSNSTVYTYQGLMSLNKGDFIYLYGKIKANMSNTGSQYETLFFYGKNNSEVTLTLSLIELAPPPPPFGCFFDGEDEDYVVSVPLIYSGSTNPTFIQIMADTVYIPTQADTILLHDAGLSICDRILGKDDSFYSEFLGGANTAIHYNSNGCGYLNTLTRGVNLRGYSFSEKPFTLSWDDYWAGVNPLLNLGLGYEELSNNSPGSTVIRMEKKSDFFNTTPSVYLTAINDIQIEFDLNLFTKTIEIGFEQWSAESASGIDDPQTKHTYNLRYQLFGKDEKQLSKFIAASLAMEQGRRLTRLQSNDWRFDENVFVIALQEQDTDVFPQTSPPTITQQPEIFDASPSPITGLRNPETRYNVRHTPARLLERWKDFYSGQMQDYLTDFFKYASGEGNVLMSWVGDACDSGSMTENQNQGISSNYLFLPIVYSFTHPLTWDEYATIRDNRKNAISISWILSGVTYTKIAFIKKLGYDINKSKANFEVWIRS